MSASLADIAETLSRLTGRRLALCETAAQLLIDAEEHVTEAEQLRYEGAVRRAMSLVPVFSLTRDAADFHLDTAARAARTEGVSGALVLELPRKPNQPTEVSFLGGQVELRIIP